jgi:pimeloyl-ACP methyl ester carboxylesterase
MNTTDSTLLLPNPPASKASRANPFSPANWLSGPLWSRVRRVALVMGCVPLAALALLATAGAIYETLAARGDSAAYPAAGRLVDVGGYRLHLDCRGEGSPTVVMDAGLGGSSLDWSLVQPELSKATRVCTYDRAGMGWSDAGPTPRSPGHIAGELHALLTNGGIKGPYILVAHSLAGKNAQMFAAAYPAEIVGMVLVDARSERVDVLTSPADAEAFRSALGGQATMYSVARRFGIARLFGAGLVDEPLIPPALATEMVVLQTNASAIEETTQEGLARAADDSALARSTLGSMPLIVIAASDSMLNTPNWPAAQSALAALSTRGRLVVARHSAHPVQLEQPKIVIDAVREVLAETRAPQ